MKPSKLSTLPVDRLVERFEELGLSQGRAFFHREIRKYNRLFDQMHEIVTELRNRPGDQRRMLVSLYEHPSAQVRLKAAIATLSTDRIGARDVLEKISDRDEYPQAMDARSMMRALDDGSYVPT